VRGVRRASYEELKEQVAALELVTEQKESENEELRERIRVLEARLTDLEERLGRNPRNSSMPPSAEGLSKPPAPNRAQRRAEERRKGKQPGGEGRHLAQVADPTEVVVHEPLTCPECGRSLSRADVAGVEVRQVFEVEVRRLVTEHRMQVKRCTCGCEVKAEAPREATAPACYGPGVRALACYLAVFQHLPYDRMAQLFTDVLGLSVLVGALAQMVAEGGGAPGSSLRRCATSFLWLTPSTSTRPGDASSAVSTGCTWPPPHCSP
jgi:transposase